MNFKSEKTFKLVFLIIICAVVAYILYVMISHYTADREAQVSLSFTADSSNIMTKANATYIMKDGEGQLIMETNEKTNTLNPDGMIGKVFEIRSIGKSVSKATLTISYSDENLNYDENQIKLMRIDENGKANIYNSNLDTKNNTVTAEFFDGGMWYLGNF